MAKLEITIQRKSADRYPIVAEYSHTDEELFSKRSEGTLELTQELKNQLTSLLGQSREYGTCLGEWIFNGDIGTAFAEAKAKNPDQLRLLLFIEAEDDLKQLRWERLCARIDGGWNFLRRDQRVPYSLYIPSITDRRFPPIGRYNLRALVLVASPKNSEKFKLPPFDVNQTVESIRAALGSKIKCDVLAHHVDNARGLPTFGNLSNQLTKESYAFLHIVCHGRQIDDDMVLYLENKDYQVEPIKGQDFIKELKNIQGPKGLPHFTFLCTCESATVDGDGAFGGFGGQLVRELGMPAVVAMTEKVTIKTAEALAQAFYRQLIDHGEVDLALDSATAEVSNRDDVLVPALFSRLGDRPLFSDTIDRPLTPEEIKHGLQRLQELLRERAPVLINPFAQKRKNLEKTLEIEASALSALSTTLQEERKDALVKINEICINVLDLSFDALAINTPVPKYDGHCPFRGLYPFRLADREFFFGREKLVKELKEELDNYPLLAVLGDSGSGKSSLVLAGLVPVLQKEQPNFKLVYMTPNYNPIEQLDNSLSKVKGQSFILVVDQFEELFTLCSDKNEPKIFVEKLLDLVSPQHKVVFTIRTDFWGKCSRYEGLTQRKIIIDPMDTTELRTAMEQQAHKVGLRFEAGLSNTILDAVQKEPGAMPLLQHTLWELWNRRHGQWLVDSEYRNFGGVKQAIATTADKFYENLTVNEQKLMQNIFVRLTRIDTEAESGETAQNTRRRINLEELIPARGTLEKTEELVNRLAGEGARLVITSKNTNTQKTEVDVAHESLIRFWPRLKDWLVENRSNYESREEIRQDIQKWQKYGNKSDYLLSGDSLSRGKDLLNLELLNKIEKNYVEQSSKAEEEKLLKDVRRARRNSRLAMIFSALLLALSGFAFFSQYQAKKSEQIAEVSRRNAEQSKEIVQLKEKSAKASNWVSTGKSAEGLMLSLSTLRQSIENSQEDSSQDNEDSLNALLDAQKSIGNAVQHAREKNFLLGHEKEVRAIAYDPNNYYIVSGGLDKSLGLWDATTGQRLATEENAHYSSIYSVAFSPDGTHIVSGGNDDALRIWTIQGEKNGNPSIVSKTSREGHTDSIRAVAFSPDGSRIVSASDDKTLRLWSVKTGRPIGPPMTGHTSSVWTVAFSPDGKHIASGSVDRDIRIWDAETGQLKDIIKNAHKDSIFSVAFSSDSQRIVSGSGDRHIRIWNVSDGEPAGYPLIGHDGKVYSVVFSPDDQTVISTGSDRTIRFWHADTSTPIGQILEAHGSLIWNIALGDEGEKIISASSDGSVRLWDISNDLPGKPQRTPHTKSILAIAVNSNGNYILTGGEDRRLSLWDANAKKQIWDQPNSHNAPIQSVAFRPKKEQFVSGSSDGTLQLWETRTKNRIWKTVPSTQTDLKELAIYSVDFSPDGRIIVSGGKDGRLRLWNASTGKQRYEWNAHTRQKIGNQLEKVPPAIFSVVYSPNGSYIASASADNTIKIWDARTRKLVRQLTNHEKDVWTIAFSPNSQYLVSGSLDKTVRVWDIETGEQLGEPLTGHTNNIISVDFSPDGQQIASSGFDKTIRLWNFNPEDTNEPVKPDGPPLIGHTESVWAIQYLPNGQSIVSGSADLSLRWWPNNWDKWVEMACERLKYHPRLTKTREREEDIEPALVTELENVKAQCDDILGLKR